MNNDPITLQQVYKEMQDALALSYGTITELLLPQKELDAIKEKLESDYGRYISSDGPTIPLMTIYGVKLVPMFDYAGRWCKYSNGDYQCLQPGGYTGIGPRINHDIFLVMGRALAINFKEEARP